MTAYDTLFRHRLNMLAFSTVHIRNGTFSKRSTFETVFEILRFQQHFQAFCMYVSMYLCMYLYTAHITDRFMAVLQFFYWERSNVSL